MSSGGPNVLHVAPTPFFADRGCHIRIRGIVLALDKLGVNNLVCTYPIGRDVEGVQSVRTTRIPGYSKTEAGPSGFKYIADLLLIFTVARQLRKFRPEVLHCHLHEGVLIGWAARIIALRFDVPIAFDMQGSLTGELVAHGYFERRPRLKKMFEFLERRIVALADLYFCSSQASTSLLTSTFGIDPKIVHLVRDGVDVGDATSDPGFKLPADLETGATPVAVYSGGLTESKGMGVLQEIIRDASQRDLDVRFLVIGYPIDAMEKFVLENGLQQYCLLTGQVPFDRLARYLCSADLALEPKPVGSGEASGKIVNYMAAGLPVICFDTPNNRDMLGDAGYFASRDTSVAFVDQLQQALLNPLESRSRGQAGLEVANSRFSWTAGAGTILDAYWRVSNAEPARDQ